jgi:predicted transcriptional regulator
MLDVVLNHIRDANEHEAKAAEKIGIDYHSILFDQIMDHLCDRGVIQKTQNGYLITLFGRQFKGFVNEAQELKNNREREEEKKRETRNATNTTSCRKDSSINGVGRLGLFHLSLLSFQS